MGNIAASVFPVPVGAISSELVPSRITGMAISCILVGRGHPRSLIAHLRGFERRVNTESAIKPFTARKDQVSEEGLDPDRFLT